MFFPNEACYPQAPLVDGSTVAEKQAQTAEEQWFGTGPHHTNLGILDTGMPCWQHCMKWKCMVLVVKQLHILEMPSVTLLMWLRLYPSSHWVVHLFLPIHVF